MIEIRPASSQVDDCLEEIRKATELSHRVLVTTLTKRLSEDLTKYLCEIGVKAKYLHSDIDTLERMQIIKDLRLGQFDVLVGINLLREGLDIPEVALVAILDADKEGFLRSETSLVQTCGRAARNQDGRVIMYADRVTASIQKTMDVTQRRRKIQEEYNQKHGITPQTVKKAPISTLEEAFGGFELAEEEKKEKGQEKKLTNKEVQSHIQFYTREMKQAAKDLRFEDAARFRDLLKHYQSLALLDSGG